MTLDRIERTGLVPVVRAGSADEGLAAADAILDGGVDILEITMTVPGAIELIRQLVDRLGDRAVVGAGTVLDREQAEACVEAGAAFVVSPGFDEPTVRWCKSRGVPVMPGALTPTEVMAAWKAGADVVKIFPASAMGGASYLKALKGPFPDVRLMPTGGVSLETASDFVAAGAVALGVGSDLVDLKSLRQGRPEQLTEKARQYVAAVRRARAT